MELADVTDSKSVGGNTVWVRLPPSAPRRSKLYIACSDFCLQKSEHGNMPLLLLFRKRSHSRRLFGCKRPHNAFGSLPTFCEESTYGANIFLRECLRHKRCCICHLVRADTQPPLRHQMTHNVQHRVGAPPVWRPKISNIF